MDAATEQRIRLAAIRFGMTFNSPPYQGRGVQFPVSNDAGTGVR
jgi:hypothetical protein